MRSKRIEPLIPDEEIDRTKESSVDRGAIFLALRHIEEYFSKAGLVYFLKPVGMKVVKVGHTYNEKGKRIKYIQSLCPMDVECLLTVSGGAPLESMIHGMLHPYRHKGEWFCISPTVSEIITRVHLAFGEWHKRRRVPKWVRGKPAGPRNRALWCGGDAEHVTDLNLAQIFQGVSIKGIRREFGSLESFDENDLRYYKREDVAAYLKKKGS